MNFPNPLVHLYALRHGISSANEAGLIISDPANGVPDYGLSSTGQELCQNIFSGLDETFFHGLDWRERATRLKVWTSDFRRARETAEIFCDQLGLGPPVIETGLRERNFGQLEKKPAVMYEEIWRADQQNQKPPYGAETTTAVARRLHTTLESILPENEEIRAIVLVSHGDTIQILEALSRGLAPHRHRELKPVANSELRPLGRVGKNPNGQIQFHE